MTPTYTGGVKICPACHQETFDGRRTCHRCGADVSQLIPMELPTEDVATLVARGPFRSRHGALRLSLSGIRFVDGDGTELLHVPPTAIRKLEPYGNADLDVHYDEDGQERRVRLRVRWARITDRTPLPDHSSRMRTWLWGGRGSRNNRGQRSARAKSLVRDRWASALERLISADRYALRRG